MLRKLMKHEIRSTSRIMLPLFAVVLILSLFVSFIVRTESMDTGNPILGMFCAIIAGSYGIALAALFIVVLVLMINRFRTNLLGDEGYVMFTLPVSIHQLIWSKIIVSCLWFIGACVVVALSGLIVAFDVGIFAELKQFFVELFRMMNTYYALNGTAILVELLIIFFLGYAACCLQFYSAMAVGYSFDRRKVLYSILFFFGAQFILQMISTILFTATGFETWMEQLFLQTDFGMMGSVHLLFVVCIVLLLVYCAIFYFLTTRFLQKRLNIE